MTNVPLPGSRSYGTLGSHFGTEMAEQADVDINTLIGAGRGRNAIERDHANSVVDEAREQAARAQEAQQRRAAAEATLADPEATGGQRVRAAIEIASLNTNANPDLLADSRDFASRLARVNPGVSDLAERLTTAARASIEVNPALAARIGPQIPEPGSDEPGVSALLADETGRRDRERVELHRREHLESERRNAEHAASALTQAVQDRVYAQVHEQLERDEQARARQRERDAEVQEVYGTRLQAFVAAEQAQEGVQGDE